MPEIKFSYEGLSGSRSIIGPILTFQIRVKYVLARGEPENVLFIIREGELFVQGKRGMMEVGVLHPKIDLDSITIRAGGETVLELKIQFSPESFQRLLEEAASRMFQIRLGISQPVDTDPKTVSPLAFFDLSRTWVHWVGGKMDGGQNVQQFKIDRDAWTAAVDSTRSASYLTDTILIMNTDRKHVRELSAVIKKAEDLLNEGKIQESIQKTREICDWAGHKPKAENNRYSTLDSFMLSSDERDGLKDVLDALWSWSSVGHHNNLTGSKSFTEEQARMSIHIAYYVVSYLSQKELIVKA